MSSEKAVSYQTTNTYSVLNEFTERTKTVWLVCHGIGYLSRYFLQRFNHLDSDENYLIAPQAPSKYYLNGKYRRVGASWLTREETKMETENVLNYLNEIYTNENLQNAPRLIILGYSQGVSVATRWVAQRKISCDQLIMHSGKVPSELNRADFSFLEHTGFTFIYGSRDEYLNAEIIKNEKQHLKNLFPQNLDIIRFEGGHELNPNITAEFA